MAWFTEQIFLTVKAYPTVGRTHQEASCMAGITRTGKWIRLYPVHFRQLAEEQRFAKYTWIEAEIRKSTRDARAESHVVNGESIRVLESVPTNGNWEARNQLLARLVQPAAHVFREERDAMRDSLGFIRVANIRDLEIEEMRDEDYQKQLVNLNRKQLQLDMFKPKSLTKLEVIPYSFRYCFEDDAGVQRTLKIVDWEIYQLYRNVKGKSNWRELVRQRLVDEFRTKDLHLFVGTVHLHPRVWLAIGVYYPPARSGHSGEQLALGLAS